MNQIGAALSAALPMSAQTAAVFSENATHTGHSTAEMPDTRRHQNLLEETMLHDLYLMSANPSLEAAARRNFNHRALTFTEMAASCKNRGSNTRERKTHTSVKSIFLRLSRG